MPADDGAELHAAEPVGVWMKYRDFVKTMPDGALLFRAFPAAKMYGRILSLPFLSATLRQNAGTFPAAVTYYAQNEMTAPYDLILTAVLTDDCLLPETDEAPECGTDEPYCVADVQLLHDCACCLCFLSARNLELPRVS